MYHNCPHVEDFRKMKKNGEKISMLFVATPGAAAAADAAGIHMLSIEGKFLDATRREAAGSCFVQVGLRDSRWGSFSERALAAAEDYLRAAFHYVARGGDGPRCKVPLRKLLAFDVGHGVWQLSGHGAHGSDKRRV